MLCNQSDHQAIYTHLLAATELITTISRLLPNNNSLRGKFVEMKSEIEEATKLIKRLLNGTPATKKKVPFPQQPERIEPPSQPELPPWQNRRQEAEEIMKKDFLARQDQVQEMKFYHTSRGISHTRPMNDVDKELLAPAPTSPIPQYPSHEPKIEEERKDEIPMRKPTLTHPNSLYDPYDQLYMGE